MQKQKPPKDKGIKLKHQSSESDEDHQEDNEDQQNSFVVDDDDQILQHANNYYHKMRFDHQTENSGGKLKTKKQEKRVKKTKKKRKKNGQESFDQDDLDLVDQAKNFVRLRKNWQLMQSQNEEQFVGQQNDKIISSPRQISSDSNVGYAEEDEQVDDQPTLKQIVNRQSIIPFDVNKVQNQNYKEIVDNNLPQRYIYLIKNLKGNRKNLAQAMKFIESSNIDQESEWMFYRLKQTGSLLSQSYDQNLYKQAIKLILQSFHRDHLDPMYIYLYRKMLFKDYVNLQLLWKLIQLDNEWHHFRQRKEDVVNFIENILTQHTNVPKFLRIMVKQLLDIKQVKYFQDYKYFKTVRYAINEKRQPFDVENNFKQKNKFKLGKLNFITQLSQRGIIDQLQSSHIVLAPHELCHNLQKHSQQIKPRSPQKQPKQQFQTYFSSSDPQSQKIIYPLLFGQNRYKTIIKYLSYDLFYSPQLKKILSNRYYKQLVITTHPTNKGNQDIDLYSMFFPVKRIRQKPINTLKRQVWILAREAQKLGHIKIDLSFEWQNYNTQKNQKALIIEKDAVYIELVQQYFDLSDSKNAGIWNIFRKRVISNLLYDYYMPHFIQEVKLDLSRQGQKEIISACCYELKQELNKGPYLQDGKPVKILALVINEIKLGAVLVDQNGKVMESFLRSLNNEFQVKSYVNSGELKQTIEQNNPGLVLISANGKRAQILRKQIIAQNYCRICLFGQYFVPRLVAKKKIIQGSNQEQVILQALSMARLHTNPMAEIISLWSEKISQNGILSMNLHPYQKLINQQTLKQSLSKVIVEMINLVGLDLNQIKNSKHLQHQIQFICGFGPLSANQFLAKLSEEKQQIINRQMIRKFVTGQVVFKNCSPFFKVQTTFHKNLFQEIDKNKKGNVIYQYESISLLDMTRIPSEWYQEIEKKLREHMSSAGLFEIKTRKQFKKLSDENVFLLQMLKNSDKLRKIDNWKNPLIKEYDHQFIIFQLRNKFRDPRNKQKQMENKQIFFNLMRETPQTLKKYSILSVKILSVKKSFLNVVQVQSGLFGSIKLLSNKSVQQYEKTFEKGSIIRVILTGFPFEQKKKYFKDKSSQQEHDLLKAEMSLDYPHKESQHNESGRHNCMKICFPQIVKQLHPLIDLQKDRFSLRFQDKPIMQSIQEKKANQMVQIKKKDKKFQKRVNHPQFKNISIQKAIQMMKVAPDGDFVIRPSSQGPDYLAITWKFFGKVIIHIKIVCEQKSSTNMNFIYRIEDRENLTYESLEEIIQKRIKPMNVLVQDITHHKNFLNNSVLQIENKLKEERSPQTNKLSYYFCVSEDFPHYFLLVYHMESKKVFKELIKVKSSGLSFHEKSFLNINELQIWFQDYIKQKDYQIIE